MIALFLLSGLVALAVYNYRQYVKKFEDIDKLPGPSTLKLIKELYFSSSSKGIINYFLELTKIYGPIVKVWIKPFRPMIITSDLDYCDKLFKDKEHHITPSLFEITFMGEGVASNVHYDIWKRDKQIVVKAITKRYIAGRLSTYDKKYDELLAVIRENLGKPINVEKHLHRILLEILLDTFKHPHVNVDQSEIDRFVKNRNDFFVLLMEKMNSLKCMGVLHKFTKNSKLMKKCHDGIVQFGWNWLKKFQRVEDHLRDTDNLVYAMMEGGIPDKRIVDNLNTMIQGGHDTTIVPLSMTFREMAIHPEIQQKLLNEIVDVMGPDISKEITLTDIDRMPYLHAVAKEAIRRYMSLPFLDRQTLYDMTINGTRIPKGTVVMFALAQIMTREDHYDDALAFRPERFLKENVTSKSHRAFVGFGYGAKACVGRNIAYAAMKLLLVKIVREFEILHVDYDVQFMSELFFRSLTGIPTVFRKRIIN